MKGIERKLDRKKREERRKNVVMKGVEVKDRKRTRATEEILREIGAKAKIEEVKKIKDGEKSIEIIWVRIENEEQKKEGMRRKKKLRRKRKEYWKI